MGPVDAFCSQRLLYAVAIDDVVRHENPHSLQHALGRGRQQARGYHPAFQTRHAIDQFKQGAPHLAVVVQNNDSQCHARLRG